METELEKFKKYEKELEEKIQKLENTKTYLSEEAVEKKFIDAVKRDVKDWERKQLIYTEDIFTFVQNHGHDYADWTLEVDDGEIFIEKNAYRKETDEEFQTRIDREKKEYKYNTDRVNNRPIDIKISNFQTSLFKVKLEIEKLGLPEDVRPIWERLSKYLSPEEKEKLKKSFNILQ